MTDNNPYNNPTVAGSPYMQQHCIPRAMCDADMMIDLSKRNHDNFKEKQKEPNDQELVRCLRKVMTRKHPLKMMLLWTSLFQATFSDSVDKHPDLIKKCGNYWLYQMRFKNPIIYSFGVGNDITFDVELLNKYQVPIYLFDPTPSVGEWVKPHLNVHKGLVFNPTGLSVKTGSSKLYHSPNPKKMNSSMFDIAHHNLYSIVNFKTLSDFMKEYNHDHIDILKLDIEGMALPVLEQVFSTTNIRPKQILAEFEIVEIDDPMKLFPRISGLMLKMKHEGYTIFNLNLLRKPTIEILAVKLK